MSQDRAVFEAVLAAKGEGRPAALATVIETHGSVPREAGSKMLVWADSAIVGTVGGGEMESLVIRESQEALRDGQTRILEYTLSELESGDPGICGGTVRIFIEPLLPPPTVVVVGAGHVGKVVAELAKWLDFRVIVTDDRPGYATPEQIPEMDGYLEVPPAALPDHVDINIQTFIVAVTRGLVVDKDLLLALLATEAPYVGLIGSRRRWVKTAEALAEAGISRESLARVHAPIGLDLGGETPKEIALSIMAEVVKTLHRATGEALQWHGNLEKQSTGE